MADCRANGGKLNSVTLPSESIWESSLCLTFISHCCLLSLSGVDPAEPHPVHCPEGQFAPAAVCRETGEDPSLRYQRESSHNARSGQHLGCTGARQLRIFRCYYVDALILKFRLLGQSVGYILVFVDENSFMIFAKSFMF